MTFDRNSIRIWLQPWFLAGQVAKCHFGSSFGNLDLVQNHDHLVMLVTYTSGDTDRAAAAAAAAESLQSCPTLCDPIDGSPPGSPSLGFSRQEHWTGLPFPSPMWMLLRAFYCYMKIPFPIKVGILCLIKLISWLVFILKVNQVKLTCTLIIWINLHNK